MALDATLRDLFSSALLLHRQEFVVQEHEIRAAIAVIHFAYSKEGQTSGATASPLDYNNAAYRCAYLHKYAACHSAMICDILSGNPMFMQLIRAMLRQADTVRICCLGGGPGTDVVGLSAMFSSQCDFSGISFQFTTVDCMPGWRHANKAILNVAATGLFGSIGQFLSSRVRSSYVCDNALHPNEETLRTIRSADMLTMIKFVSAADPKEVANMLQVIFFSMKAGAVVLFIDNAGGGFYEKVFQAASICGLVANWAPQRCMKYEKAIFKNYLFGTYSLSSTTVAVQMWKKPLGASSSVPRHLLLSSGLSERRNDILPFQPVTVFSPSQMLQSSATRGYVFRSTPVTTTRLVSGSNTLYPSSSSAVRTAQVIGSRNMASQPSQRVTAVKKEKERNSSCVIL